LLKNTNVRNIKIQIYLARPIQFAVWLQRRKKYTKKDLGESENTLKNSSEECRKYTVKQTIFCKHIGRSKQYGMNRIKQQARLKIEDKVVASQLLYVFIFIYIILNKKTGEYINNYT